MKSYTVNRWTQPLNGKEEREINESTEAGTTQRGEDGGTPKVRPEFAITMGRVSELQDQGNSGIDPLKRGGS